MTDLVKAIFCIWLLVISNLGFGDDETGLGKEEPSGQSFSSTQIHGFATVGAAINDQAHVAQLRDLEDNLGIPHRGDYWAPDSRLGLQIDQQITSRLSASIQAVAAHRVVQSFNNNVQWAFMRYNLSSAWTVRLGRVGVDTFMLSDHRNVGFSYLWVRPPIDFYGYVPLYSVDGADAQYQHPMGSGVFIIKAYGGKSAPVYYIKNSPPPEYTEFSMHPVVGLNLIWKNPNWTIRISGVTLKLHNNFNGMNSLFNITTPLIPYYSPLTNAIMAGNQNNTNIDYLDYGINYDNGRFLALSEFSTVQYQSQFKANTAEAYLTIGMHLGAWTPFLDFARAWETRTDYQVPTPSASMLNAYPAPLAQHVQAITQVYNQNLFSLTMTRQYTGSLGVRWDFANNMDLKAQYDLTHVYPNSFDLWTNTPGYAPRSGNVSMFSLTFDTIF